MAAAEAAIRAAQHAQGAARFHFVPRGVAPFAGTRAVSARPSAAAFPNWCP
jgi:hypothetical protein